MKINKIILSLIAILFLGVACEDEDKLPIVVLDTVEKGAYPRLIDQTDKLLNLFNVGGSTYTYNIEFVDIEGGTLVDRYVVDVTFDDNSPENGDNTVTQLDYIVLTRDQFTPNDNGYQQAPTISVNGSELLQNLGLTEDQVTAGDDFDFVGRIELSDGRTFSQANSSATIVGPSFRGHFNYTMPAACPSDLTGTYAVSTSNIWCGGSDVNGDVTIQALGGGVYRFNDWSFGSYGVCYGGGSASGDLTFTEVCAEVSFTGFTDSFGDTWTYTSSIAGEEWTIEWTNTYGESAASVITFPGGVPFTLEQ